MAEKEKIIQDAIAAAKAYRQNSNECNRERYEEAFKRLYKCYYPRRLHSIKKRCRSEEDAEEICHDVFQYIWEHLHEFE
jgi:DNA-directed RNA polymerase specialized sigma24 family protein